MSIYPVLRAREKTTSGFHIPSSGHFRSLLGRKILELALLVLRFYSRGSSEPGAESGREKTEVIFSRTLTTFSALIFSSCITAQPSGQSPDALQQLAAQAALYRAATPIEDVLVWTIDPDNGLATHWVRGNHASATIVASRLGLLLPANSELWELREVEVEIPLCDCELWAKKKQMGECPRAEEVAYASIPIMVNSVTGNTVELLFKPTTQEEESLVDKAFSLAVTVTGSVGPYLFISKTVERTPCGDGRVSSNSTFHVFNLASKRMVQLFEPEERQRMLEKEQTVAYEQFRTDASILIQSSEDLQLTRIEVDVVPGVGLTLGYQFTARAFFADSKGNRSTYVRSTTVAAKTIPQALVPFAEFPSGLHRVVVLKEGIRIGGWALLTSEVIEHLRIHNIFDQANNTN